MRDSRPRGARKSGYKKGPTEAGSGGKRGHSGMENRVHNHELKEGMRRLRRQQDRSTIATQLRENEE